MSTLHRKVFTIFLAAPGDLSEERQKTREAVARFCKVFGSRLGWHVDLLGWEDTLPGYARPQSIIDQDVDRCDLFIGILWRRWGQPTGKYDSGFHEEFMLARARHRTTGRPNIWLFFKSVDPDSLKDPGEQLKKVIRFKDSQIAMKELFFKEFPDTSSWSELIYDCLSEHILDLVQKESQAEIKASSSVAEESAEITLVRSLPEEGQHYPQETVALFDGIATALKADNLEGLDFWKSLRLLLQSSAWVSGSASWKLFDNHEINYVYQRRKDWRLTFEEWVFLVRSFLQDNQNVRPGWWWLGKGGEERVDEVLSYHAEFDTEDSIRKNAFSLLADTKYRSPLDLIKKGLADSDEDIVLSAIRLLGNAENLDYIDLLEPLIRSNQSRIKNEAIIARLGLIYPKDPNAAFKELVASGIDVPPVISDCLKSMDLKVDTALLMDSLQHGGSSVRRFSAQYLRNAKLLKQDTANSMLSDTDPMVRKEGILALIDLGSDYDLDFVDELFRTGKGSQGGSLPSKVVVEEIYPLVLKNSEPSELLASIGFFSHRSDVYYHFLAIERFSAIEARIRRDLDDEFQQLRRDSEAGMRKEYGDAGQSLIDSWSEDLIGFQRSKFISAGLAGLAKNGTKDDVKYARKYLGGTQYNMGDYSAITIMAKYGDNSDVGQLVRLASTIPYEDIIRHAILTALDLSTDKFELVKTLVNNDSLGIAETAMNYVVKFQSDAKTKLAKECLLSKRDEIRLVAVAILMEGLDESSLEGVLSEYVQSAKYYYNVVSSFDRYLYAPARYKTYFREQISGNLH